MKIFLEKAIFINRVPFERLELDFSENEVAILAAVNGKGKTTILSHIVDSFHEMARPNFSNYSEKRDQYYRVSTPIDNLDQGRSSFVYLRYKTSEGFVDYLDVRKNCSQEEYDAAITLENKIPYAQISQALVKAGNVKQVSASFNEDQAKIIFGQNLLTYFPSYRYESPGYLNNIYQIEMNFEKTSRYSGRLSNPIEVISGLPTFANWILDVVLDLRVAQASSQLTFNNLNYILTQTLISKGYGDVRFGIGPRGLGGTRIQITTLEGNQIYPTIFNLSSGEAAILCIFGELLRQGDRNNKALLKDITGIVLIDEVDKHLHIKLQKEILPQLFKLFPQIQFIVSSHAPFLNIGLAEVIQERSKIIDLDNFGITKDPTTNAQYTEVYNMMVTENQRFKESYEALKKQVDTSKSLQIVTEGKNTKHIQKAIEVLDASLLQKIAFVAAEEITGAQQLKNAFDVMSRAIYPCKFLFVWDCDAKREADKVVETSNFFKYRFEQNNQNALFTKGVENLYPITFIDDSIYDPERTKTIEGGGQVTEKLPNKSKFLQKAQSENDPAIFENFKPLLQKIREITAPPTAP